MQSLRSSAFLLRQSRTKLELGRQGASAKGRGKGVHDALICDFPRLACVSFGAPVVLILDLAARTGHVLGDLGLRGFGWRFTAVLP